MCSTAWLVLILTLASCVAACRQPDRASARTRDGALPVGTSARAAAGSAADTSGQWTMAAGDYASTRFSALDEINAANVARLKVAWTFSTGMVAGHEAAPLIVGSTMYLVT